MKLRSLAQLVAILVACASSLYGQVHVQGNQYWPTPGSGLTLNLSPGYVNCFGSLTSYAGGTLAMAASTSPNYVYLNTASSCVPAVKSTAFTVSDIPIAEVVTSGSAITSITDVRTPFVTSASCGLAYLIPCLNSSNTWTGGTQTFITGDYLTVGTVHKGSSAGYSTISLASFTPGGCCSLSVSSVSAGQVILFYEEMTGGGGTSNVPTDSLGDSYTQVFSVSDDLSGYNQLWTTTASSSGSLTISENNPCCNVRYAAAAVWNNVISVSMVDGTPAFATGSTLPSSASVGPISTSFNGDVVVSQYFSYPGVSGSPSVSGYTVASTYNSQEQLAYAQQSSAGTYSTAWSTSGVSGGYAMSLIALRAVPSGGQSADLEQFETSSGNVVSGVDGPGFRYDVPGAFASLPACSSAIEGTHAVVNDSTVTSFGSAIVGGGSGHVPAYCNGTSWVVD